MLFKIIDGAHSSSKIVKEKCKGGRGREILKGYCDKNLRGAHWYFVLAVVK